jgi:hypothetical protein
MAFEDLRIEMMCKDFHTLVEEGLKGDSLSIAAQEHVAGCRPCREFNHKHVELREWLAVCEQITAPKDFQFGVQRKIANSRASHTHGGLLQSLKYIVPVAGMAAILMLFFSYSLNNNQVKPSGDTATAAVNSAIRPQETGNSATQTVGPAAQQPAANQDVASTQGANKVDNSSPAKGPDKVAPQKEASNSPGGSSTLNETLAVKQAPSALPPGIKLPKSEAERLSETMTSLRQAGIVTNTKLAVIKIMPAAAGTGVKEGDVVESFSGNTVTVNRGGQTVQLSIH